jgi:hypothetical protein
LKENARQGFWNGSLPPIGYRVVAAEQRSAKVKKKLEIDPLHAETVRLIYRLALHGDGAKGQMGFQEHRQPPEPQPHLHARRRPLGHRPSPPHPDPPHLYGRA